MSLNSHLSEICLSNYNGLPEILRVKLFQTRNLAQDKEQHVHKPQSDNGIILYYCDSNIVHGMQAGMWCSGVASINFKSFQFNGAYSWQFV